MNDRGWAVITGASGGIGLELARCAARDGYKLVLVSSEVGKLRAAAGTLRGQFDAQLEIFPADLATEAGVSAVLEFIGDRPVEVLVNNAGFATWGPFIGLKKSRELAEVRLNMEAVVHLCHGLLPGMVKRRSGKVLNVASTAAFLPGPLMSTYYATKAFVLSFSQGLAAELEGSGVTVTALCPGPTRTGFVARAHLEDSKLFKGRLMSAVYVAMSGWRGMKEGKIIVVPGRRNWVEVLLVRFVPHKMLARMVMKSQERQ